MLNSTIHFNGAILFWQFCSVYIFKTYDYHRKKSHLGKIEFFT
jgi:hypothetical protein